MVPCTNWAVLHQGLLCGCSQVSVGAGVTWRLDSGNQDGIPTYLAVGTDCVLRWDCSTGTPTYGPSIRPRIIWWLVQRERSPNEHFKRDPSSSGKPYYDYSQNALLDTSIGSKSFRTSQIQRIGTRFQFLLRGSKCLKGRGKSWSWPFFKPIYPNCFQ